MSEVPCITDANFVYATDAAQNDSSTSMLNASSSIEKRNDLQIRSAEGKPPSRTMKYPFNDIFSTLDGPALLFRPEMSSLCERKPGNDAIQQLLTARIFRLAFSPNGSAAQSAIVPNVNRENGKKVIKVMPSRL